MSAIYVEYTLKPGDPGYTDRPLAIQMTGRLPLRFDPSPAHDGRRVEVFSTEEEAMQIVSRYGQAKCFAIVRDLMSEDEQRIVEEKVASLLKPVEARLAALELEVGATKAKRRSKAPTATTEA